MKKLLSLVMMLSLLLSSSQSLSLVNMLSISDVFAAVDTYTVSGGDIGALPDVGAASAALNTITITEDGSPDDFGAVEIIRVTINTGTYPNVRFDESIDIFDIVLGGTCGYDLVNLVSYSSNNQIVDINIEDDIFGFGGGDGCLGGEDLTIAGLKVLTTAPAAAPGAAHLISIDNTATSSGSPVNSSSTINLGVSAGDSNMSLFLASPTVGATSNGTLSVTVGALENTDYVEFSAPANLNVTAVAFDSDTFAGAGVFVCTNTGGQTVRCTANDAITTSSGTIVMTGFDPLYAATGQTLGGGIVFDTSAGSNLTTDTTAGTVTDTVAADANASVVLADATVGGVGDTTVTLDLPFALDANDTIDITFPAIVDVSGVGAAVTGTLENTDSVTCAAAGQVVTCTTSAATNTGAGLTIIMTGITGASVGADDITVFEIEDEGIAANDIATDVTVDLTDVTAAATAGGRSRRSTTIDTVQEPPSAAKNIRIKKVIPLSDNASSVDVVFVWESAENAISEHFRINGITQNDDDYTDSTITIRSKIGNKFSVDVLSTNPLGSTKSDLVRITVSLESASENTESLDVPPKTPQNLRIGSVVAHSDAPELLDVEVLWDAVDNATGYDLHFNGSAGTFFKGTVTENRKTLEKVPKGSSTAWVSASNAGGSSAWSSSLSQNLDVIGIPQNLRTEKNTDGEGWTLYWDAVDGVSMYFIYSSSDGDNWTKLAENDETHLVFSDRKNAKKYYAVESVKAEKTSQLSKSLYVDFPVEKNVVPAQELIVSLVTLITTTTTIEEKKGCDNSKMWTAGGSFQQGDVVEYKGDRYQTKGFASSKWGTETTPDKSEAWVKLSKCGEANPLEMASFDPGCPSEKPYKMKDTGKCVEKLPMVALPSTNLCEGHPAFDSKADYVAGDIVEYQKVKFRSLGLLKGSIAQHSPPLSGNAWDRIAPCGEPEPAEKAWIYCPDEKAYSVFKRHIKGDVVNFMGRTFVADNDNDSSPLFNTGPWEYVKECPSDTSILPTCTAVLCPDGSCKATQSECSTTGSFNGCPAATPIKCSDGSCKMTQSECSTTSTDVSTQNFEACTLPFIGGRGVLVPENCQAGSLLADGQSCELSCADGYKVSEDAEQPSCSAGSFIYGNFECRELSSCDVTDLDVPRNIDRASVVACKGTLGHDKECALSCREGYTLSGSQPSCFDGTFDQGTIDCIPNACVATLNGADRLTPPANGIIEYCGEEGAPFNTLEHQEYCTFSCEAGYRLSDSDPTSQMQCFAGSVRQTSVTCEDIDECKEGTNLCQQNCTNTIGGYQCGCEEGYEVNPNDPTGCTLIRGNDSPVSIGSQDTNVCESSPCGDNGICTETSSLENGYICQCNAGWSGESCEIDIDECEISPCQNGGTCVDKVNAYICSCPSGYSGANCEMKDVNSSESISQCSGTIDVAGECCEEKNIDASGLCCEGVVDECGVCDGNNSCKIQLVIACSEGQVRLDGGRCSECPVGKVPNTEGDLCVSKEVKKLNDDLGIKITSTLETITVTPQTFTSSDKGVSVKIENTNEIKKIEKKDAAGARTELRQKLLKSLSSSSTLSTAGSDFASSVLSSSELDQQNVLSVLDVSTKNVDATKNQENTLEMTLSRSAQVTVSKDSINELLKSIAKAAGVSIENVSVPQVKVAGSEILSKRFNANGDLVFRTNVIKDFEILPTEPKATVNFSDVTGDLEEEAIFELRKLGIIAGNPDGMYRPNDSLNRAATSKIISELAGIFPDDAQEGDLWFSAQQRALKSSYITNGNVDPINTENKVNFLALVAKSYNVNITELPACTEPRFTDVPVGSWYCPLVEFAISANWILERDGLFNPAGDVSRSWAAGVVWRTMQMND